MIEVMMMKGLAMDENMSNLTSTSSELSASSGTRVETGSGTTNIYPQQSFNSTSQAPPQKKKRSLPGNPDPDAEVMALSPKTILATNRFICEICNKGFQRDQNLQLHRRGHNLPWKLKQRANKEMIRKKVYVCPEPTCVHHDPSRALGDLTGIKKHFCRKHGEKKWKCEKCSKRYAVQSDWKAHFKICGTREYRCDCGTLFSRRDSFITHRAFCNALAGESARSITNNNNSLLSVKKEDHQDALLQRTEHNIITISPSLACQVPPLDLPTPPLFCTSQSLDQNPILPSAHMSATALLHKAAQMGVTMSSSSATGSSVSAAGLSSREGFLASLGNKAAASAAAVAVCTSPSAGSDVVEQVGPPASLLHDVISSLPSSTGFESGLLGFLKRTTDGVGNEEFTRDFLGLKDFPETADFLNISGLSHLSSSSGYGQQNNQNQTPWQL